MSKEAIYDLDNSYFLYQDIEDVFDEISIIYEVKFEMKRTVFIPKISVSKEHYWISDECNMMFNKLVPKIKSVTKNIYSIIEGIYKSKKGEFNIQNIESEYENFKELRLFNNKIKHHNNKVAKINLTKIVFSTDKGNLIDCHINYKYITNDNFKTLRFSELINVFLLILETEKIIEINRK